MNGGAKVANRKRKFVLRVPVTPEERALIQQKMAQLGTKNFSAYARKMLIDGYIVHIDTGPVRAQTAELQKIGVNINQIASVSQYRTVYAQDLEDIKGAAGTDMAVTKIHPIKSTLEKGPGLHRKPGQDRRQAAGVLLCLFLQTADIEFEILLAQAIPKGQQSRPIT